MHPRKRIAIVGSGCAGIGAAWALQSTEHEVHLFEKASRLGGHTNTCTWEHNGQKTPVDTGFIVMNSATYPNFIRFLKTVRVDILPTLMTFGVSRDHGAFEWSGTGPGIFAQRENIFSLRMWRLIFDIIRFNQFALDILDGEEGDGLQDQSIGDYLDQHGYSDAFKDDYLIPMTAAVWSTSPDKCTLDFPALTLVRFMWNHHLLSTIATRPDWLTISGGSQQYIDAVLASANKERFTVHLSSPVTAIRRIPGQRLQVTYDSEGQPGPRIEDFDHVIFACHGDEILPILSAHAGTSPAETTVLSKFQTTENWAYLHSDLSLMPQRRACWTAWNYLSTSAPSQLSHPAGVSLTYWMNLLQHIPEDKFGPVLVTMNPDHPPDKRLTQGKYAYRHPLYTAAAVRAQQELEGLQNISGVSYCGAWTKYGFHEDGFSSGLRVAVEHLGAKLPFEFVDSTYSRGKKPAYGLADHLVRTMILLIHIMILVGEMFLRIPPVAMVVNMLSSPFAKSKAE